MFKSDRQRRAAFANMFSIKAQNVSRGKRLEQKTHARLGRSNSIVTMRSVGSRGTWDMVAITPDKVRLIQAKTHGYIEPKERAEMLEQLQNMPDNVQAELEYYVSPRVTKNFTLKKAGETDWDKVKERLDHFGKVRGYKKRSGDSEFSFYERKNSGWYPANSNLPEDFPNIVRKATFDVLRNSYGHYNPDDMQDIANITGQVCMELDKSWKPEWGGRPHGRYISADVEDALEDLR